LVEKGAIERAKRNLARLQSMCGDACPETVALRSTIAVGTASGQRFAVETAEDQRASN
jgi:hypothetical protein